MSDALEIFEGWAVAETEKAIGVINKNEYYAYVEAMANMKSQLVNWLPRSQLSDIEYAKSPKEDQQELRLVYIEAPAWILDKRELMY